jgi:site-specific recombinase XerD
MRSRPGGAAGRGSQSRELGETVAGHPAAEDALGRQLEEYLLAAVEERALAPRTVANYYRDLGRLVEFFRSLGVRSATEVTRLHLREWLSLLRRSRVPVSTTARLTLEARHFLRYAAPETAASVFSGLALPRAPRGPLAALSQEDVLALLETPGQDQLGLRDRAVLAVLYATGLRLGELVALETKQVDLAGSQLRCWDAAGYERPALLGPQATAALARYLVEARPGLAKGSDSPALFLSQRGQRLSGRALEGLVCRHGRACGLAVTPLSLRQTCAQHLRQGGATAYAVRRILGATLTTSRRPSASS